MPIIQTPAGTKAVKITLPVLFGLVLGVVFLPPPWGLIPMLLAGAGLALLLVRGNFDLWLTFTPAADAFHVATLSLTFPAKRTIP